MPPRSARLVGRARTRRCRRVSARPSCLRRVVCPYVPNRPILYPGAGRIDWWAPRRGTRRAGGDPGAGRHVGSPARCVPGRRTDSPGAAAVGEIGGPGTHPGVAGPFRRGRVVSAGSCAPTCESTICPRHGRMDRWRRVGAHGGPAAILGCAETCWFAGPMRARSTNRLGGCRRGWRDWWAGHAPRRCRPVRRGRIVTAGSCAPTRRIDRLVPPARAGDWRAPRRGTRRAGGDPRLRRDMPVRLPDACPGDEQTRRVPLRPARSVGRARTPALPARFGAAELSPPGRVPLRAESTDCTPARAGSMVGAV